MRTIWQSLVLAMTAFTMACGADDGSAPEMKPMSDEVTYVGQELSLEISATDGDGDALEFGFTACHVSDEGCKKEGIGNRADLRQAGNLAIFRWTPIMSDVGMHSFDFTASDGKNTAKQSIAIEVKVDQGSSGVPVFRKPLGAGTSLDLSVKDCIDLPVLVEDADSLGVTITQDTPLIEGAQLRQDDPFSAAWRWCPTAEQIQTTKTSTLRLLADDGESSPVSKSFLIQLLAPPGEGCAGDPPVIEPSSAAEVSTVLPIAVEARVRDDKGLTDKPLLYYSFEAPAEPLDLAAMTQVTMDPVSGDLKDGVWAAEVPNPVASKPQGTVASVYYVIIARDDDEPGAKCSHVSKSPLAGAHLIQVTNAGGSGGLGLCKPCTADMQCGDAPDLCAALGSAGDTFCFSACTSDQDCPTPNYVCGPPITSVGGESARQCVPNSGSCTQPGDSCVVDTHEPDDDASQARTVSLSAGPYHSKDNTICAWNEDWFGVNLQQGATLHVSLAFMQSDGKEDLDILLYQGSKNLTPCDEATEVGCDQQNGQSWTSNERMVRPISESGMYYVVVRGFNGSENEYDICISLEASQCP